MQKLTKTIQKSLTILMLLAYSIVLMTPMIALANESTEGSDQSASKTCSYATSGTADEVSKYLANFWITGDENTPPNEEGTNDAKDETFDEYCGKEPNPVTGYYEKGDCSAAGKVITELVEGFAANTNTGVVVEIDGNLVVNLYKGACCSDLQDKECNATQFIYTDKFSTCEDNAVQCERVQWVIGESGVGIVKVFVKLIYIWGAGIAGFIAVVVIVISGIQISVSGVSGDISSAKNRIIQSISGLVLIFLSGIILYVVNPTFFS